MTGNMSEAGILRAKSDDVLRQCCHIMLSTGAEAFYLNGQFIADADPAEGVPSLLPLARSIAQASDCALSCYVVPEPDDE